MASYFEYPCPGCRSTSTLHDPDCRFDGTRREEIERAYFDVLAVLSEGPRTDRELKNVIEPWTRRHEAVLETLERDHRVREGDNGLLEFLTPEQRKEAVSEPDQEPIATIYERGSWPGCHDNSIFALIAWYEMVGFSWEETRELVVEWLTSSGAWDRGGFEESTPAEVVENKRHVYEEGYGWLEAATEAKAVIDRIG